MAIPVITIFDIGKTNKKIFLFDENYDLVYEKSEVLPETTDEDGDPCENVEALSKWIIGSLNEVLANKDFEVKAVNFATYGASFVFVNNDGTSALPLYNYLKKYPEDLKKKFYDKYGGETAFSLATASPVLGSLNSGMLLYRLKNEKPKIFSKIKYALHLPQYISFLISKITYSDLTSIGCHTNLWDFKEGKYHSWLSAEGIEKKLAPIIPANHTNEIEIKKKKIQIGIGLHDSSAALIPYLMNFSEPFALISTGTWCITLNPFNQSSLTETELKQDCLCYLQYNGHTVKASRLFAGHFHDEQTERIAKHFGVESSFYKQVKFNDVAIAQFSKDKKSANPVLNESLFADRELTQFKSAEQAYLQLMIDLVSQQAYSSRLALNGGDVKSIYVDGGFCNNSLFMNLMALSFADKKIYAATLAQATALGAALSIHSSWNSKPIPKNLVQLKSYSFAKEHQL
jgi:sugar (pentulose or hexulose) kinase